jgi:hypothetical protein
LKHFLLFFLAVSCATPGSFSNQKTNFDKEWQELAKKTKIKDINSHSVYKCKREYPKSFFISPPDFATVANTAGIEPYSHKGDALRIQRKLEQMHLHPNYEDSICAYFWPILDSFHLHYSGHKDFEQGLAELYEIFDVRPLLLKLVNLYDQNPCILKEECVAYEFTSESNKFMEYIEEQKIQRAYDFFDIVYPDTIYPKAGSQHVDAADHAQQNLAAYEDFLRRDIKNKLIGLNMNELDPNEGCTFGH